MPGLTYAGYMMAAMDACSYVKGKMTTGAANSLDAALERGVIGQLAAWLKVKTMRSEADLTILRRGVREYDGNRTMEIWADTALKYGCGNCGEQSALAFKYLRSKGVGPLDWAHFTNRDHAFVLLNRPRGLEGKALKANLDQVILCDPYYNKKGPLDQFPDYNVAFIAPLLHYEDGATL